ncbi:AAA family ATPase [Bosea sp. (in: a-proteobacteria)]|uniref:AAA family ATPase n=1 Tax=Bosea sp. (in: a-proteobacteria) TaxID=1871050 RepID=UPI001AD5B63B|nr:AAA family ATPase [Bosea sp. (in: a-proteobacteria)]MBN9441125.1 AAA family ATPase [Bosea sp. (in: a-proteobacteria)]
MSGLEPLEEAMAQIAEQVWGAPRPGATRTEIRYGEARTVNPQKGRWWDHGDGVGGGPLKLLEHALGLKGRPAFDWLRQHGFPVDDAPASERRDEPAREQKKVKKEIAAIFDYVDERGEMLFQAVRFEWDEDGKRKKSFGQRRPDASTRDGWSWKLGDVQIVPYRLTELQADISNRATIFFVEGEKCVDLLRSLGVPATTNPMGAGKWWDELTPYFQDADVVFLRDNDEPGLKHRDLVGSKLAGVARRMRALDLPKLQSKEDIFDWIKVHGGTVDALYDLVDTKAVDWQPDKTLRPKLASVLWRDLDKPGPEHEWLIEDVLTVGEVSMIAGPSRHGKSFAAVDEGLSVARGVPWLGNATVRGGVIYIAAESGRGVKKRLRAYRAWNELKPDLDLPFILLPGQFDLYGAEDNTKDLLEDAKLYDTYFKETFGVPLRLIIIDTFAAATPGADENSSKDIGLALKRATQVSTQTGANVQLVHHMNAGGTKPRGWTGILANIDTVATVEKHEKRVDEDGRPIRYVTLSKNKDGEDGRSFRFVLRQVEVSLDKRGKPITSCVCVPPKEDIDPERTEDAGFNATDNDRQFLQCISDAQRTAGDFPPNDLKVPARIKRVVLINKAKAVFKDRFAGGETGSDEQIRTRLAQRWKRAHDRMVQYGIIGSSDPWMWLTGKPVKGMRLSEAEPKQIEPTGEPEPSADAMDELDSDVSLI